MYKHIADSIPSHVQSDLSIDKKNIHQRVIRETLKRSGKAIKRQNSKYQRRKKSDTKNFQILKQLSEVAEHQKEIEDSRPQHWDHIESNLTFEIIVRRIQRRFRLKRNLKRIKSIHSSADAKGNTTKEDIFGIDDDSQQRRSFDDIDMKLDFSSSSAHFAMVEMVDMKATKNNKMNEEGTFDVKEKDSLR